ncbi:hypothetical protein GC093_05890 [Paenibacillus sp. LMG 31456]|uniref:Uncharacterized protein n=1 Tax=Paenibacillus foliorum TaxID=2654974 RepID=A0A972GY95_9BACL|nr:hypothetical protein [Paenibacillus foliorum]NOU92761.1 hypothetical protein [Paenibacillus foliorum]
MNEIDTGQDSHYIWKDGQLYSGVERIGHIVSEASSGIKYRDEIKETEEGVFQWTRSFTVEERQTVAFTMGFQTSYPTTYGMIPAVTYNGNTWGSGLEPKGFEKDGQPWTFAYHRAAVAGATYSEGSGWSVGLFGQYEDCGFSCSLTPQDEYTVHRLIWPLAETPVTYVGRDRDGAPYREEWLCEPDQEYRITAYLVIRPLAEAGASWSKMLEAAWGLNYHAEKPSYQADQLWQLGIRYAKESLWAEEGIFKGFSIGLKWNGEAWEQRKTWRYKIGWTGQNISLANSLLVDYLKTGDLSSLEKGIVALDTWANHARLDNGLIRCHFDHLLENKPSSPEIQDAVHLGAAAMNYFEAYELANKCGVARPSYKETALGICSFAVEHQNEEGKIGKAWNNEGIPVDPEGTIGSSLVPPLIKAYNMTNETKYLEAAEQGYRYYIRELLDNGFTTAGALDTYCIDKESAIPLLKAGLGLYEATTNVQYLQWAEAASWYLATWQWHHTVAYPEGSALHALGYDTLGGTSVSTQHHHIDPYALDFVTEWLKLGELTGNAAWIQRARAAWVNGSIGISDGTLKVMNKLRPVGSQDEGYYHTRWGFLTERHEQPFDVTEWLVAWPTAFRLEVLRHLEDWSVFE